MVSEGSKVRGKAKRVLRTTDKGLPSTPKKIGNARLEHWNGFASALCKRFGPRLEAGVATQCGEGEFLSTVRRHPNWQDWACQFGWDKA